MGVSDGLTIEPIIGLEIHVQLATQTKMFCGCAVEFGAPPNTRVCPVCLGLPGALPVINARAVEFAIRTGLALSCRIAEFTKWDRKSYYYPDLPKNYQISQYDLPLCLNGHIEIPFDGRVRKVRVRRAHLEEDAGKNVHDFPGITAVDLNRAGTPLLEIVSEPDLRSPEEAREFAVQVQRLVRYLGVSEANMQKGQMRFEPNINVHLRRGDEEFRTPIVEVKNLNSFKSLYGAIRYEIQRQVEQWRQDGITAQTGNKANRGWDDVQEITLPQREKEEAHDYRYFPDPDLVPLRPNPALVAEWHEHQPELPITRTERFISEYKLSPRDVPALVDVRATADLLDHAAEAGGDKLILAKHFISFWATQANARNTSIAGLAVPAARMAALANLVRDAKVNATGAGQIAERMAAGADALLAAEQAAGRRTPRPVADELHGEFDPVDGPGLDPAALAEQLGLLQSSDEGQIAGWVEQAFAANAKAVQDALSNPKKIQAARGFLTGAVMKVSGGKADPKIVGALIERRLSELAAKAP